MVGMPGENVEVDGVGVVRQVLPPAAMHHREIPNLGRPKIGPALLRGFRALEGRIENKWYGSLLP
jgi:hypothetical protein